MENLRELTCKRGQIKAKLTRFKNFLDSLSEDIDLMQVKVRFEKLEEIWQAFEVVQSEIECLQQFSPAETCERDFFEESYYEVSARAQSILLRSQPYLNAGCTAQRSTDQDKVPVKLPVINLPSFSGNYDEWMNFHDTFRSLIHENEAVASIQKFHYLRSALFGEALQVLASLTVSADNYNIAWDLLTQRYENKRYLISRHVKALFDMTRVERESSSALRQLLDDTNKNLRALTALGQPTDHWNAIILHLVTSKLDAVTFKEWEATLHGNELPDCNSLLKFLQNRCQTLETVDVHRGTKTPSVAFNKNKRSSYAVHVSINLQCNLCGKTHQLYQCKSFLNKSVPGRLADVKRLKLCSNCLKSGHYVKDYRSSSCRTCNQKHNTLLHVSHQPSLGNSDAKEGEIVTKSQPLTITQVEPAESALTLLTHRQGMCKPILLSTAVVWAYDSQGATHHMRVLLDSGSQSNFISERMAQLLQLKRKRGYSSVSGISGSETKIYHMVNTTLKSRFGGYKVFLDFLVLPKISRDIPYLQIDISRLQLPPDIQLADPEFHSPQRVDGLLGAEVFWDLFSPEGFSLHPTIPTLRKSTLGWIIGGRIGDQEVINETHSYTSSFITINDQLQRFWQLEECSTVKQIQSPEQLQCERHFVNNIKRDKDGRFIVKLPLRESITQLGESRDIAIRRLLSLERRLQKDEIYRSAYIQFMEDYERQHHMEVISDTENRGNTYYIPHHAVIKPSSSTTKLRVVFDASCSSSSGVSLNDVLMVGPLIQEDIFSILIRFRLHRYAITADIEQMYRQIKIDDDDTNLQRIIWRSNPDSPLLTYRLRTVTYGTAAAPFLATRCLQQLAYEEEGRFPIASAIALRDFYVDDLITGADTCNVSKFSHIMLGSWGAAMLGFVQKTYSET